MQDRGPSGREAGCLERALCRAPRGAQPTTAAAASRASGSASVNDAPPSRRVADGDRAAEAPRRRAHDPEPQAVPPRAPLPCRNASSTCRPLGLRDAGAAVGDLDLDRPADAPDGARGRSRRRSAGGRRCSRGSRSPRRSPRGAPGPSDGPPVVTTITAPRSWARTASSSATSRAIGAASIGRRSPAASGRSVSSIAAAACETARGLGANAVQVGDLRLGKAGGLDPRAEAHDHGDRRLKIVRDRGRRVGGVERRRGCRAQRMHRRAPVTNRCDPPLSGWVDGRTLALQSPRTLNFRTPPLSLKCSASILVGEMSHPRRRWRITLRRWSSSPPPMSARRYAFPCDEARRGGDPAEWWVAPDRPPWEPPATVFSPLGARFLARPSAAARPATGRRGPARWARERSSRPLSDRAGICRLGRVSSSPTNGAK